MNKILLIALSFIFIGASAQTNYYTKTLRFSSIGIDSSYSTAKLFMNYSSGKLRIHWGDSTSTIWPNPGTVATTDTSGVSGSLTTPYYTYATGLHTIATGELYRGTGGVVGLGTASPARLMHISKADATNGATYPLRIGHKKISGTISAMGTGIEFENSTAIGTETITGMLVNKVNRSFGGSPNYYEWNIHTMGNSTLNEALIIESTNSTQTYLYGPGKSSASRFGIGNSGLDAVTFNVSNNFTAGSSGSHVFKLTSSTGEILINNSAGTSGYVLTSAGAGAAATWQAASGASGLTVGTTTITSGTSTRVLYDNAGTLGEYTVSGSGNVAMTTSPTFTTPALGTPSALVGTNITGTAAGLTAGNVTTNANLTGEVTSVGNAASLGSFTSSSLATALTNETGSGAAVFATSPTLVTPALGTPSALVGTNITGTASSLTAGAATILATARNIWGQSFDGSAAVTGSLTSVGDITGGASNMTITSGTGASRTLTLKTTTSGSTATTGLSIDASQVVSVPHYTTNGGLLYTDGSGVVSQTGAGTSTTLLHGGTSPSYSAVSLTADVSGVLPPANGGTGIAGSDPVFLTGSDVSNSTTSLADATGLSFSVVSGSYFFEFFVTYTSAAGTTGSGFSVNTGATVTGLAGQVNQNSNGSNQATFALFGVDTGGTSTNSSGAGTYNCATVRGIITVSSSGTVILRFASEVAASAITIKGGSLSFVRYFKII